MRKTELFNKGWRFCEGDLPVERPRFKGPVYSQSKTERKLNGPASYRYNDTPDNFVDKYREINIGSWQNVDLPHDYIISQRPDEKENNTTGYFHYHNAWYRKHFRLSEEDRDKRISIIFEGVATHATVYLNGCLMKHNFCGYTTFEVDITDNVYFDQENILAVYVTTDEFEGWWYQGGGIYRNVWLKITDRVCLDLYGVYARIEQLSEADQTWKIDFETTVRNENYDGRAKRVTAVSRVIDADGTLLAEATGTGLVGAKEKSVLHYSVTVKNPKIWDIDSPNLYTVETSLSKGKEVCDSDSTRIGFRTAVCDPDKGFFLNGRHVKIKGVCAHQDFGLTGLAVPDNILRYKVSLLKEMGANGYRCSHYPHPAATMDALDELGFIVMDETRWFESTEEGLAQLEMVIKRDRNRPSVFFWSLGNEEPHHKTDVGRRINQSMYRFARKLDDQRFLMSAVSNDPQDATVYANQDVIGINYNLRQYETLHQKFPNKAIFSSECCATSSTRGFYAEISPESGYLSAKDMDMNEWFLGRERTWQFIMERDWVMGEYQWIGFEHRGETLWPRLCSQSGAIDLYLQKKDAFYQNLSHWSSEPMVHMLPHWNWIGYEGREIEITAYTNCEELELFLNGKSFGRKTMKQWGHGNWNVPFTPGEIRVVGYRGGKPVAEDGHKTTGDPVALKLRLENNNAKKPGDIALFTCYAVDKDGNEVPDAREFVTFHTNGRGAVVGTGSDVCDHEPVVIPARKMREGKISVAVKLNGNEGPLTLYAEGDRLHKTVLTVEI